MTLFFILNAYTKIEWGFMKIWKLTVQNSPGYVRIRAANEPRAREIAYETFAKSKADTMIHPVDWSKVAWHDSNQVNCELEDEDIVEREGILDIT